MGGGERRRGFGVLGRVGGDGRVRFGVGRDPVRTRGAGFEWCERQEGGTMEWA